MTRLGTAYPAQTYNLTNASQAGWGLSEFINGSGGHSVQDLCLAHDPNIVVVLLGTNDTYDTVELYTSRLTTLVGMIQAHTNADGTVPKVVLMQPPIAMDAVYGTRGGYTGYISSPYSAGNPYQYGRPKVRLTHAAVPGGLGENPGGLTEFKNAVSAVGASLGVPVGTTWDTLAAAAAPWDGTTNTSHPFIMDGVHLTTAGSVPVGDTAFAAVSTLLNADGAVAYEGQAEWTYSLAKSAPAAAAEWTFSLAQALNAAAEWTFGMLKAPAPKKSPQMLLEIPDGDPLSLTISEGDSLTLTIPDDSGSLLSLED
jgi:lysophospholipase L1-like esterase